jgi:hypothetical protein
MTIVLAASEAKRGRIAKQLGCLLALQVGLGLLGQAAFAEDAVAPNSATPNPATGQATSSSTTTTTTATSTSTSSAAPVSTTVPPSAPAAASAPGAAATANDGPLVEPGPAEARRTALLMRIFNAKSQGIGIDAYLNAFAMLENSVKTGETEANLNKRIDSLNSSLDDQLKRSAVLKTQRPAPPVAASGFPAGGLGSAGGSSAGGTSDLIRKLQEKYGDQIPANLKDKLGGGQIPENLKDKIPAGLGGLDPGQIEDLIKKYKK